MRFSPPPRRTVMLFLVCLSALISGSVSVSNTFAHQGHSHPNDTQRDIVGPYINADKHLRYMTVVYHSRYYHQVWDDHYGLSARWLTTRNGTRFGIAFYLFLDSLWHGSGQWLLFDYDCSARGRPVYRSVPFMAAYRDTGGYIAYVDIRHDRLIGFQPSGKRVARVHFDSPYKPRSHSCQDDYLHP